MIRAGASIEFRPSQSITSQQRALLINGYDNCLAYLDAQVGKLVEFLDKSSYGKNTIVILTADHGEGFGEHGAYGHGNDLHREEIHVPLVILGPGIPAGKHVVRPVSVRGLFATAIDLAVGNELPFHQYSMSRFWEPGVAPPGIDDAVVSEVSSSLSQTGGGSVSLTTPDWQYIRTTRGDEELYRWPADPVEKNNLSTSPACQPTLDALRARLQAIIRTSVHPWLGREYLVGLAPSASAPPESAAGAGPAHPDSPFALRPLGSAQDYLDRAAAITLPHPTNQEKDLLNSLLYQ